MSLVEAKANGDIATQNQISKKIDDQIKEINVKFQSAIDILVQSYDQHMKVIIPKPKLLPVRVSVQIESQNNLRIENLNLKPYESFRDLLKLIEDF